MLNMQAESKRSTVIEVRSNFFEARFETEDSGRGPSRHPSILTMESPGWGKVELKFKGEFEFDDFQAVMALLAQELEMAFGKPLPAGADNVVKLKEA